MVQYFMQKNNAMTVAETLHDRNGRLLAESHLNEIIGEVEIIYKSKLNGKSIFTRTIRRNDLLVTGGIYLCEKINQLRFNVHSTPIDVSLGVHKLEDIDQTTASLPFEKVCGIMVGNGGSGDTYNTVHRVHKTDLAVPGMIPFRVRNLSISDLDPTERAKYILRVEKDGYAYYYGKKFEITPEINVHYEDGAPIDITRMSSIGDSDGRFIKTYTKYEATITESDMREYFRITQGSTLRCLINSIGLMTGYPMDDSESEFGNVRGLTTLNMENAELKDSESTVNFIYRLHFV